MMRAVRKFWVCIGVLLSAVLLTFAMPAAAAPPAQANTGTITGQVLSLDNAPLPAVRIAAYSEAQTSANRTAIVEVRTDAQGRYSVQVPAGTIWMGFLTQDILGQSFWGYDNLPVTVAAGQTVTDQNFVVAIRVVSEPPTAVPAPVPVAPAPLPGMPTTGAGPDLGLPLVGGLGLLLILLGIVQRRATQ
jgi:hypothetical protein